MTGRSAAAAVLGGALAATARAGTGAVFGGIGGLLLDGAGVPLG